MEIKCDIINCKDEMKTFYFDLQNDSVIVCRNHKKEYLRFFKIDRNCISFITRKQYKKLIGE